MQDHCFDAHLRYGQLNSWQHLLSLPQIMSTVCHAAVCDKGLPNLCPYVRRFVDSTCRLWAIVVSRDSEV